MSFWPLSYQNLFNTFILLLFIIFQKLKIKKWYLDKSSRIGFSDSISRSLLFNSIRFLIFTSELDSSSIIRPDAISLYFIIFKLKVLQIQWTKKLNIKKNKLSIWYISEKKRFSYIVSDVNEYKQFIVYVRSIWKVQLIIDNNYDWNSF